MFLVVCTRVLVQLVHINRLTYLVIDVFLLCVLGWYIPGISELPLGHRRLLLPAGQSLISSFLLSFGVHIAVPLE